MPVQRIEQTVAPADLQASPQAIAEAPDIKTLDKDRLAEARKINHTNKPLGLKLGGWKPPQTKPRKQELWQAGIVFILLYFEKKKIISKDRTLWYFKLILNENPLSV